MSRPKLSLPLKRAQAALQSEEHLMQQVAADLDSDVGAPSPETEAVLEALAPKDETEAPRMIESIPYATVRGEPGVEYVQGRGYYDRQKRFVKFAPEAAWYFVDDLPAPTKEAMRTAAIREIMTAPRLPSKILDAEKENARALAAETLAE